MINPNNLQDLSNELENTLGTPVSINILEQLSLYQRKYLTSLIWKWTQGANVEETIEAIIYHGKAKLKPNV
jgi:hypothetical protein